MYEELLMKLRNTIPPSSKGIVISTGKERWLREFRQA